MSQVATAVHKQQNETLCQPVWLSGEAIPCKAEGLRSEFALALLCLQKEERLTQPRVILMVTIALKNPEIVAD